MSAILEHSIAQHDLFLGSPSLLNNTLNRVRTRSRYRGPDDTLRKLKWPAKIPSHLAFTHDWKSAPLKEWLGTQKESNSFSDDKLHRVIKTGLANERCPYIDAHDLRDLMNDLGHLKPELDIQISKKESCAKLPLKCHC